MGEGVLSSGESEAIIVGFLTVGGWRARSFSSAMNSSAVALKVSVSFFVQGGKYGTAPGFDEPSVSSVGMS